MPHLLLHKLQGSAFSPVPWQPHLPLNSTQIIVICYCYCCCFSYCFCFSYWFISWRPHFFKLLSAQFLVIKCHVHVFVPHCIGIGYTNSTCIVIQLLLLLLKYHCNCFVFTFLFLEIVICFCFYIVIVAVIVTVIKMNCVVSYICWFCYCFLSSFRSILAGGLDHKHCRCLIILQYNLSLI